MSIYVLSNVCYKSRLLHQHFWKSDCFDHFQCEFFFTNIDLWIISTATTTTAISRLQRELARQTFEIIMYYIDALPSDCFPVLRPALLIGGVPMKDQLDALRGCVCWMFTFCFLEYLHIISSRFDFHYCSQMSSY